MRSGLPSLSSVKSTKPICSMKCEMFVDTDRPSALPTGGACSTLYLQDSMRSPVVNPIRVRGQMVHVKPEVSVSDGDVYQGRQHIASLASPSVDSAAIRLDSNCTIQAA